LTLPFTTLSAVVAEVPSPLTESAVPVTGASIFIPVPEVIPVTLTPVAAPTPATVAPVPAPLIVTLTPVPFVIVTLTPDEVALLTLLTRTPLLLAPVPFVMSTLRAFAFAAPAISDALTPFDELCTPVTLMPLPVATLEASTAIPVTAPGRTLTPTELVPVAVTSTPILLTVPPVAEA